ncbi:MAG: hypothetical protein WCH46_08470 [bacterium]
MKKTFLVAAFLSIVSLNSCSPDLPTTPSTMLNHDKIGSVMYQSATKHDTNTYIFSLSCGCGFEFGIEKYDTTNIRYDVSRIAVRSSGHTIKAYPAPSLMPGTYYGSLALVTLKPDTQEDFRDTLRDTLIVQ